MPDEKKASKRRILLVDDHPLLRQGIGQLINEQADLVVCGEAEDRAGALQAAENTHPDLAVVDLSLRSQHGLELIKDFKTQFPGLLILVLSMHDESFYGERALRAGARGYIMKREASSKVLEAIRHVLDGGVYASSRVTGSILNKVTGWQGTSARPSLNTLTDRELEVLMLIGKGHGSREIARRLNLSVKTIEAHRANIKVKLNLESSHELLQHAIRWAQETGET
jgi:DNA-binding NarL/FixJ family response regulator